jgi:basic membrane lipoprotein Med (substrate-binding protein (PBP1-ABC) superfamily)
LAPELVVASQQYDWTGVLKEMIKQNKAGKFGGETYVAELKNGGLKIVYNSKFKLPDAAKKAGDKAIKDITSGAIKVKP